MCLTSRLKVAEGDGVERGQALTEGSIDPKELLRVTDVLFCENYLLREVQAVYRGQGVENRRQTRRSNGSSNVA